MIASQSNRPHADEPRETSSDTFVMRAEAVTRERAVVHGWMCTPFPTRESWSVRPSLTARSTWLGRRSSARPLLHSEEAESLPTSACSVFGGFISRLRACTGALQRRCSHRCVLVPTRTCRPSYIAMLRYSFLNIGSGLRFSVIRRWEEIHVRGHFIPTRSGVLRYST